jgi:hypothetical protein
MNRRQNKVKNLNRTQKVKEALEELYDAIEHEEVKA